MKATISDEGIVVDPAEKQKADEFFLRYSAYRFANRKYADYESAAAKPGFHIALSGDYENEQFTYTLDDHDASSEESST